MPELPSMEGLRALLVDELYLDPLHGEIADDVLARLADYLREHGVLLGADGLVQAEPLGDFGNRYEHYRLVPVEET